MEENIKTVELFRYFEDPKTGEWGEGKLVEILSCDADNILVEKIELDGEIIKTNYSYDENGNEVEQLIHHMDTDLLFQITKEYNSGNYLVSEYNVVFSEGEEMGRFECHFRYNDDGKIIEEIFEDSGKVTVTNFEHDYDGVRSVKSDFVEGKKVREYVYEDHGDIIVEEEYALNKKGELERTSRDVDYYDSFEKLIRTEGHNSVTEYTYYENGRQESLLITTPKKKTYYKLVYTYYD